MEHGLVYLSNSQVTACENNFLGQQLDIIPTTWNSVNIARDSWFGPTWDGRNGGSDTLDNKKQDIFNTFSGTGRKFCIHYLISDHGSSTSDYASTANGSQDTEFNNFAQKLVDNDMADTIIRPSAEFNLSWGRYPNDPQNYADAFARCVREYNSVGSVTSDLTDGNFTFLYSPAGNSMGVTEDAWPVDSQYWPSGVDPPHVCWSWYNSSWVYANYSESEIEAALANDDNSISLEAWNNQLKDKIDMGTDFANSKGAPKGNVEWGPATYAYGGGTGGEDDPYWIHRAFDYFELNDYDFQTVWNVGSDVGGTHRIVDTDGSINAELSRSANAWKQRVLDDTGTQTLGNYNVRQSGEPVEADAVRVNQSGTAVDATVYLNQNGDPVEVFPN